MHLTALLLILLQPCHPGCYKRKKKSRGKIEVSSATDRNVGLPSGPGLIEPSLKKDQTITIGDYYGVVTIDQDETR
jgi:hypothetical protein